MAAIHIVKTDTKAQTLTVQGTIESAKLLTYIRKKVHKHAEIVSSKTEEEKKKEEEEKKKKKEEEEKKKKEEEEKKKKEEIDNIYGIAMVDGFKEKISNFRIEPPGLFLGRGKHPKTGKIKQRVTPEQGKKKQHKNTPLN